MSTHQPTVIAILGGAGDLAQRKLFPALFDLYIQEKLPTIFTLIGLARTNRTDEEYRALVKSALILKYGSSREVQIDSFCEHMRYVSGSFVEEESYKKLGESITLFESTTGICSNKLFYLAVPPSHYADIFKALHKSKLAIPCKTPATSWARILVEKPFGSNYKTAEELDKTLGSLFNEDQIFRIDHYLAKEAVQNILSFRFANTLLQSPWNKDFIKEVHITMHETLDVGTRGAFYDSVGALRDVGQNHLLQILALIAMDEPASLTAEHIRSKRADILQKLVPITKESILESAVRAQYEGYTDEQGVAKNSDTETYFECKAFIDTPTWNNVPFFIKAGKALRQEKVTVEIIFHDVATGPFETKDCATVGNVILLTISPEHSMHITLNMKKPGHGYEIESHTLSYTWDQKESTAVTAYEKVLLDCILGDQTLFTKTEEVLASWKFTSSIIDFWDTITLQTYTKGSDGPEYQLSNNRYL